MKEWVKSNVIISHLHESIEQFSGFTFPSLLYGKQNTSLIDPILFKTPKNCKVRNFRVNLYMGPLKIHFLLFNS